MKPVGPTPAARQIIIVYISRKSVIHSERIITRGPIFSRILNEGEFHYFVCILDSLLYSENAIIHYWSTIATRKNLKDHCMNIYPSGIDILFLLSAFGIVSLSKVLLHNHPKIASSELEKINPKYKGIQYIYLFLYIVTGLVVALFSFWIFDIRKTDPFVRIFPVFASIALFDGCFAIITNAYPVITRSNWDRFVYDGNKKLRWVAILQITLSVIFLIVCFVFFIRV